MTDKLIPMIRNDSGDKRCATVLLYDTIGADDWTGQGVSAKGFAEQLNALGDLDEITMRVNSPGGSVFDGLAIYNTLLKHPANVVAEIEGLAASAASVVIQAANEIRISASAFVMIHQAQALCVGPAKDMMEMAAVLEKMDDTIANVYAKRSGRKADTFAKLMAAETWFTGQEAVDAKLADSLTAEKKVKAAFNPSMLKNYRNMPAAFAAVLKADADELAREQAELEEAQRREREAEAVQVRMRLMELEAA